MKLFALIDCNNFYVSCERVFNPHLLNKPVIVLSNNDGCIIARSNEAKALGFGMGQPVFECEGLIRAYNVQVYSSNFALYGDMSARVMQTIMHYIPDVEIYSIDEAFIKINPENATACIRELSETITCWTGIPVSIGIAPTKTLAKIANKLAKKQPEFNGICNLTELAAMEEVLKRVPVADIWGVGYRYTKLLQRYGISTAYQLVQLDDTWIRKKMTIVGLKMVWELRGISCIGLQESHLTKKSIACTRSFAQPLHTLHELDEAVALYVARAAEKLRAQGSLCSALYLFCSTGHFTHYYYANAKTVILPEPTDYTPKLIHHAHVALAKIFKECYRYKRAGVVLMDFVQRDTQQLQVEQASMPTAQQGRMIQAVDMINQKWGRQAVRFAAEGLKKGWHMKQCKKSPAFTTHWDDIPIIKL